MKVVVSILCQDPRVFFAMEQSGTLVRLKVKLVKLQLNNGKNMIS